MLNQNDMHIGSFYSLNKLNVRLYDFGEVAFFRIGGNIIAKDFYKLEGINFDNKWKKKILPEDALILWKYAHRQFVHEVQRDYFNDFGKELTLNVLFDGDKILD